jgi:hypothetical protein
LAEADRIIAIRPFIFPIPSPLDNRCQNLLTVAPSRSVSGNVDQAGMDLSPGNLDESRKLNSACLYGMDVEAIDRCDATEHSIPLLCNCKISSKPGKSISAPSIQSESLNVL